jgi:streptomycin 6-kinase
VIDPKPFVGDPAYDATQHLMNCEARMRGAALPTVQRFAGLLDLDADRLRRWMFARPPRTATTGGTMSGCRSLAT